ncbi:inhibitor of nuclear factor kappa-B kinase subunit alpha [Contarinia nasturtii]|uniref:inhibitor of nuclear factor kappa-B kinase subunit alpha n=1 Tax=Contarinia nasturtii TaxID=265458 RepID=UPI0012D41C58|nr:inhibitor of nuclear factor kappa-B kinase subunit alpha [Contarinia nasturtii]XP_031620394.1 inhibitor of nuclear factor kappa-B kinase subunit alpha [Contarinia nasturtii]
MLENIPFIGDWHRSIKLGCGAFADVWLWQHGKTKEKIVVRTNKVLGGPNASKDKEQWEREIDLMTNKIRHINIVRGLRIKPDTFLIELLKSHPSTDGILITEYCEGVDLRKHLNYTQNACGMPEREVRNILQTLKNVVSYLHSMSVIVRDIKPDSIIIHVTNDGRTIYKLTDLGCSKPNDFRTIDANQIDKMCSYIAPELITSDKYNRSVDYWSIGTILYETITGTRPFVQHLPLAKWILCVREKKSEHITITEDDTGEFIYSDRISNENHLSHGFAKLLVPWFKLALEWNGKQRGSIFEKSNSVSNENVNVAPVQTLKFFETVDHILEQKILTIFVLTNHKHLNFLVDDNTTNADFLSFIEQETRIPISKCYIITSTENCLSKDIDSYQSHQQFNKPIDLYIDNYFDKPMVFVTQCGGVGSTMAVSECELNKDDDVSYVIDLPASVRCVLNSPENRLKIHSLWKFARDTLYFVRKEINTYKTCLDGWLCFARQLANEIEMCQSNVRKMQTLVYGTRGSLELFKQTLDILHEKQHCDAKWLEQYTKIMQNVERLVTACNKIEIRYGSVHRRIREISHNELLIKMNTHDGYGTINVIKAYDTLRAQLLSNRLPAKPHFELFNCAFKCLKQRESLLRNKNFIEIRRNLNCVHNEFIEIKKTLEKAIIPAEKYRIELNEANKSLNEHVWSLVEKSHSHVSTSTSDLTLSNTNSTATPDADADENAKIQKIMRQITEENAMNTKLLIEDNINLRIEMANLMQDMDEELKSETSHYDHRHQ